jgi:uncharacterized membrane protein YphA (DoxX/SURF4 family)
MPIPAPLRRLEHRALEILRPLVLPLLRTSLALVFVWFGALKITGGTPVGQLVAGTVPWLDPGWFLPALGAVEVVLGVALLTGRATSVVAAAMVSHLAGTFLVLVTQPAVAFQHGNPLQLTVIGEFVVKNLVLICGVLVLVCLGRRGDPASSVPDRAPALPAAAPRDRAGLSGAVSR